MRHVRYCLTRVNTCAGHCVHGPLALDVRPAVTLVVMPASHEPGGCKSGTCWLDGRPSRRAHVAFGQLARRVMGMVASTRVGMHAVLGGG